MPLKEKRSSSADGAPANEKVVINVGGVRHETYTNTLRNIPDTRLYWISENSTQLPEYDPNVNEFFFDRHPTVFGQILNFYRTGKLHCPNDVCGPLFEEELAFWGIDELQVESCCWLNYKKHREAQANLDTFDGNESDRDSLSDMDMTVYGLVANSIRNRNRSLWKKYQPKVWSTFEEPYSSRLAQVIAFTTLMLILASVITFCLESVPYFQDQSSAQFRALYVTEIICVTWFTVEFVMRLIFCPRKLQFFKKPMNWIDFCAILPFFLERFINESNIKTIVVLRVVRLIRVFRIFKLSRHSYGLQILGHTLKSSCSELFLLGFFLSIGVVIFSSIIYYAEKDLKGTKFTTIPHSFWWAVVTMTTLGYGDMSPKSWEGKIVGSLCAVSGVLMIALPVPVIVSNFSLYYSHAKARLKLPKRKRPLIIGAANALKIAQSFVTQNNPKLPREMENPIERDGVDDDTDREDLRPTNRSRRPSRISIRSTPRGSPVARRKFTASPTTVITPPSSRNSFLNSTLTKARGSSLLAVPEAERIEIEMQERTPPFKMWSDEGSPPKSPQETTSQEPLHAEQSFAATPLEQNSEGSLDRNSLSPKSSDIESGGSTNDSKTPLAGRQRSSSSAQSLSIDSTQGSPKVNPRGRMGRRGSLYVVGFTAKHWQNKALKKNKKTQAAQTEPGSRRDSASSTARRGSIIQGAGESSALRNGGAITDSSAQYSPPQMNPKSRSSAKTAEIADLPESEAAGLTRDYMPENGKRKEFQSIDERNNKASETAIKFRDRTIENYGVKSVAQYMGKSQDCNDQGKAIQTSVSLESSDSSSKWSDDSLTVNDRHRQRRGSSPLVRQKAVFTFDMPDHFSQVDPTVGSPEHTAARWKTSSGRAHDDGGISLSPLIEHANEHSEAMDSGLTRKVHVEGRRNSCLPAITTERRASKKNHSKSRSIPNGYINGSYHEDEEERVIMHKRPPTGKLHPGSRGSNGLAREVDSSRTRSESYPMFLSVGGESYQSVGLGNSSQPFYTEAKSLGQYSKPPQRHSSSISDTCLPSISEEQAILDSRAQGLDMYRLVAPVVLPRPQSLPDWPGDMVRPVVMRRPFSDSMSTNQRDNFVFPVLHSSMSHVEQMSRTLAGNIGPPVELPSTVVSERNRPVFIRNTNSQAEPSEDHIGESLTRKREGGHNMLYVHEAHSDDAYNGIGIEVSQIAGAPRMPNGGSLSTKERSRSKGNTTERATSPLVFQRAESFSTPELHSLSSAHQDPFFPRRIDSNLSKSWYQLLEGPKRKITFEDVGMNGKHSFVNYSSLPSVNSQEYLTSSSLTNFPEAAIPYDFKSITDISIGARHVSNERPPDHIDNAATNSLHNGTRSEGRTNSSSPRLERSDRHVIYNGHEGLQPRDSLNRTNSVFNRQRARAIFVGDSGIDSVGSTSVTSMTHSLESETEGGKDSRETASGSSNVRIDIMNPIHETETESTEAGHPNNGRPTCNSASQTVTVDVNTTGSLMTNILSNPDLCESSLV